MKRAKFISAPVLIVTLFLSLLIPTPRAQADEFYTFVVRKQEEKKKSRWSLDEWLVTRDRMRLMDLWLALHSPSPYEFFIAGDKEWGSPSGLPHYDSWRWSAAAYVQIFGLEVIRETSPLDHWLALFDARIFGYHAQGTNITLQGGIRSTLGAGAQRNPVLGGSVTLYLVKGFGVETLYRRFLTSTPGTAGLSSGSRWETGAFLDYSLVRIGGDWFSDNSEFRDSTSSGVKLGLKFFL